MPIGDGIRRNVATISHSERNRLRDAIIALHHRFYPGGRNDTPVGGVSYWFKQDEIHQATHVHGGARQNLLSCGYVRCRRGPDDGR